MISSTKFVSLANQRVVYLKRVPRKMKITDMIWEIATIVIARSSTPN